jgi:hypothetical protein
LEALFCLTLTVRLAIVASHSLERITSDLNEIKELHMFMLKLFCAFALAFILLSVVFHFLEKNDKSCTNSDEDE